MKFFTIAFLLVSSAAFAASISSEVPNPALSLMASEPYQAALGEVQNSIKSQNQLDESRVVVVGFEVSDSKEGMAPVAVILGAPTKRWPTCIERIGKVTGVARYFPDGINYLRVGNIKFEAETPSPTQGCN